MDAMHGRAAEMYHGTVSVWFNWEEAWKRHLTARPVWHIPHALRTE